MDFSHYRMDFHYGNDRCLFLSGKKAEVALGGATGSFGSILTPLTFPPPLRQTSCTFYKSCLPLHRK